MLFTNLLLACGLSTAVGSGLALKENSNYLYHEKPQEQLHLDIKKNAVDGDLQLDTWYDFDSSYLFTSNFYNNTPSKLDYHISDLFLYNYEIDNVVPDDNVTLINNNAEFSSRYIFQSSIADDYSIIQLRFITLPTNAGDITYLKGILTLSENQNIGSSTTQEVFDVVGETTTGFIDVLTSAIQNGTELIYKDGNFTFLGVMLLIATGISVVFWIFRLLRGITEGVSR